MKFITVFLALALVASGGGADSEETKEILVEDSESSPNEVENGEGEPPVCPPGCFCDERRTRASCHPLASGVFDFSLLPQSLKQLDLAKYGLKSLSDNAFASTPALEKLDLQNNDISALNDDSLSHLDNLEVLDLSMNSFVNLNGRPFKALRSLKRLKLADNRLSSVEVDTLRDLENLVKIDISENPFICDCRLKPFLEWLDSMPNALSNPARTKCALPIAMADVPLKKLDANSLTCGNEGQKSASNSGSSQGQKRMLNSGSFSRLKPSDDQVVFEGDSLEAFCEYEKFDLNLDVRWFVRGKEMSGRAPHLNNYTISKIYRKSENLERITLSVSSLSSVHSGKWACVLESDSETVWQRSVNVLVITKYTRTCPPTQHDTSRGSYSWGVSVGGYTAQQSCKRPLQGRQFGYAYLHCREGGEWATNVNVTQCAYTNEVTDSLHKFAGLNLTQFESQPEILMQSAAKFLNFTDEPGVFRDPMDVVYFARAVENFLPYLRRDGNLGHNVLSMIENTLSAEPRLMEQAQLSDESATRLMRAVNNVTAVSLPKFEHSSNKLAIESYDIKPPLAQVTCTWYGTDPDDDLEAFESDEQTMNPYDRFGLRKRVFHCSQGNKTSVIPPGEVVLASVILPKSIYTYIRKAKRTLFSAPVTFAVFVNSAIFPTTTAHPDFAAPLSPSLSPPVIGADYFGQDFGDIDTNDGLVSVVLRTPKRLLEQILISGDSDISGVFQPVWWDPRSNGGFGSWRPEACTLKSFQSGLLWFQCKRLGFYSYRLKRSALAKMSATTSDFRNFGREKIAFRFHHPAVYVGSSIAFVLLMVAVVVYIAGFAFILMSRPYKHALINNWLSSLGLIYVFTLGVHQTEHEPTCKGVGMALHYLTLCHALWILLSLYVIYRKATQIRRRQTRCDTTVVATASLLRHRSSTQAVATTTRTTAITATPVWRFYALVSESQAYFQMISSFLLVLYIKSKPLHTN